MNEAQDLSADSAVSEWVGAQQDSNQAGWLVRYAQAINLLDTAPLREYLEPDLTYESQSVFEAMHGSAAFLEYLEGKLQTIRASRNLVVGELANFPGGKPCVALYQAHGDDKTDWLGTPIAAMTVSVSPDGKARSMLMITCAPSPATVERSGLFPGHPIMNTDPTLRWRRNRR